MLIQTTHDKKYLHTYDTNSYHLCSQRMILPESRKTQQIAYTTFNKERATNLETRYWYKKDLRFSLFQAIQTFNFPKSVLTSYYSVVYHCNLKNVISR